MKPSIRKKIFFFTATLSLALIAVSIAVASVIFTIRTRNDSLKLCQTSAKNVSELISDTYGSFIVEYKSMIYDVYTENKEEIETYSLDMSITFEERAKYFDKLLVDNSIFPASLSGNGMIGGSYSALARKNNYNAILQQIELVTAAEGMVGGFVIFYDKDTDYVVYLLDSTAPTSLLYNFPCSVESPDGTLVTKVFNSSDSESFFDGDIFSGYSPIIVEGSTIAYVGFYYSIDKTVESQRDFLLTLILIMTAATIVIVFVYMIFADRFIVRNVRKLSDAATTFTSRIENGEKLDAVYPDVRSNDEIGTLSEDFVKLQTTVVSYARDIAEKTAKEQAISAELDIARKIQMQALPSKPLEFVDARVSGFIKPAKEVGGDLLDYFVTDDGKVFFVIADVSGKGVPAALFMMRGKEIINSSARHGLSPCRIAKTVNDELCKNNDEGLFITAFIGLYDGVSKKLTFTRAGHEQPFLVRDGVATKIAEESNFVLGSFPMMTFVEESIILKEGDKLFAYTDGLNEGVNADYEEFGYDRIKACLESGKVDLNAVYENQLAFIGDAEQFDDLTMLLLETFKCEKIVANSPDYEIIPEITDKINGLLSGADEEKVSELDIVLDELINNYVSYAFKDVPDPQLEITATVYEDKIKLVFVDNGKLFNPLKAGKQDTLSDAATRKLGGVGITIVKSMSDKISYSVLKGKNALFIEKNLKSSVE